MVIIGNWRTALIGGVISLVIFGVMYFTVIKPDNNTANQAIRQGLAQSKAALTQAQSQINAANQAAGAGSAAAAAQTKAVTAAASKQISNAQKLATCVQSAGTNISAVTACQSKYQG